MRSFNIVTIPKSLKGKTAVVRVDFNEPTKNGKIADSFRIKNTAPLIKDLLRRGARVVLLAHLEDPITKKQLSFKSHTVQLSRILGQGLSFVEEYSRSAVQKGFLKNKVVLLENVRFHKGEEKNDTKFSNLLAAFGDLYINEAFSVSHRAHASIVGLPRLLPSYAGELFTHEVEALSTALHPARPFLLIVGGAKFDTKYALLKNFLPKADFVFLGGVLANTFLAAHSIEIGTSMYESHALPAVKKGFLKSKKILLPFDVRTARETKDVFDVSSKESILDVGPDTIQQLVSLAQISKYVLWNGPLGYVEKGYDKSTRELLNALSRLPKTKVILGGGDTLSVLDHMKLHKKFYHVSTGGGAMLDFLADGTLPGIEALKKSKKVLK
ncbi:MAG: phosphoglycerate kinase [Patescibacteria group bacterium]